MKTYKKKVQFLLPPDVAISEDTCPVTSMVCHSGKQI